jgi:tetratricopeptide (TPR) repeat protein
MRSELRNGLALLAMGLLLAACAAGSRPSGPTGPAGPPPEFVSLTARGLAADRLGEAELARTYLAAAQAAAPHEAQGLCNLAAANDRTGRDLAAAYWYRACLAANPGDPATVRQAALRAEGRSLAAALNLWDHALAVAAQDPVLHQRKAEVLALTGRADEARQLAQSLAAPGERDDVLAAAATMYGLLGDVETAKSLLDGIADPQRRDTEYANLPDAVNWTEAEFEPSEDQEAVPDTALDDWLRLAGRSEPALDLPTADYGRDALARGQAEGDEGLAGAAADYTEVLVELLLTDRFWRRMP